MADDMTFEKAEITEDIIKNTDLDRPVRAKSLVATIYGDVIESYGGKIWLGDLISLVDLFDISERLLRTSVFRLADEGWLKKTRRGRRSFYEMTTEGKEQTKLAGKLIYFFKQKAWNGVWDFVISTSKEIPQDKNTLLRHRLSLMGFGVLSKNIYVHPDIDNVLVKNIISELGLQGQVLIMQSQHVGADKESNNKEIVKQCCSFADADLMYRCFLQTYEPVLKKLKHQQSISDQCHFMIRILLLHDYRRLLFKDPQLPAELLPIDWSGITAKELVKEIYKRSYKTANSYYLNVCSDDEIKPRLKRNFSSRFGGLS